jgi:hypothetical protein
MPRVVMILNEGEPREVDGLRVTARVIQSHGRRIRVVLDVPPKTSTNSHIESQAAPSGLTGHQTEVR